MPQESWPEYTYVERPRQTEHAWKPGFRKVPDASTGPCKSLALRITPEGLVALIAALKDDDRAGARAVEEYTFQVLR